MRHRFRLFALISGLSFVALPSMAFGQGRPHAQLPPCQKGGGQIVNNGTLTLKNCIVAGNHLNHVDGAGILNDGTLTLVNVTIKDNNARGGDGGGINNQGTLTGTHVRFVGNSTPKGDGGGLYNEGVAVLRKSKFVGNTAAGGDGGGLYNNNDLTLKGVTLRNNSASGGDGGGIYNGDFVRLEGRKHHSAITTLVGNSAKGGDGGGLYNADATVQSLDAMIMSNSAFDGGGIFSEGGRVEAQDTGIVKNTVTDDGAGLYLDGASSLCCGELDGRNAYAANVTIAGNRAAKDGGGIFNNDSTVQIEAMTVADNHAAGGPGGGIVFGATGGTTELKGDILARNTPANCEVATPLTDDGFNLETGKSCGLKAGTDLTNVGSNVKLGRLAKIGRFLWGEPLLPGSRAIDAWPMKACTKGTNAPRLESDEVDTRRPKGSACDIGAFELKAGTK